MSDVIDLPAAQILSGLDELTEVLKLGPVRAALDIEKNARTARQHDLLARLHRSLSQYATKNTGLSYVGLIGHFSSGKSSTINSILSVDKTADARETGQNPTDRFITLISHPANGNSLLGIAREGNVTIRYHGLENALLENMVLVDTPGSGDPGLVTEMVRDFLPLCDIILFLFSAASPFDEADVSLLQELHNNLGFVPIHFVVTRANEFITDSTKPLSPDNLDIRATRKFFDALIPRINDVTHPKIYNESNFTLIDNNQKYNVEKIVDLLMSASHPANVDSKIAMRDHKLFYFRRTSSDILEFFVNFIVAKKDSLKQVVEQSQRNIERYNQAVSISNVQLTRRWHEHFTKITSAQSDARTRLSSDAYWYSSWESVDALQRRKREVAAQIAEEARRLAGVINARLRDRAIQQIEEHSRTYRASFDIADYLDSPAPSIVPIHVELRKDGTGIGFTDPKRIAGWWEALRKVETEALGQLSEEVRRRISQLDSLVRSRGPFLVAEQSVEETQEQLLDDLRRFFTQVELYLDGVVSLATKENVAALGIGGQLDDLLVALQETDKASFEAEAKEAVFPESSSIQLRLSAALAEIGDRVRKVAEELRAVRNPLTPALTDDGTQASRLFNSPEFKDVAEERVQLTVDHVANEATKRVSEELGAIRQQYVGAIAQAKRERTRRYFIISAGVGVVFSVAIAALFLLGVPVGSNVGEAVVWGVVGNLVGDVIGFFFSKITDSFPNSKRDIRARFEAEASSKLSLILADMSTSGRFNDLELTNVAQFSDRLNHAVDMAGECWGEMAEKHFSAITNFNTRVSGLADECMALIEQLRHFAEYFADPEKTLESLTGVGERIKQHAIEPSFQLLDSTQKQLEDVENRMRAIRFT